MKEYHLAHLKVRHLLYVLAICDHGDSGSAIRGLCGEDNELPGCITQAESLPKLMSMIQDAKKVISASRNKYNHRASSSIHKTQGVILWT